MNTNIAQKTQTSKPNPKRIVFTVKDVSDLTGLSILTIRQAANYGALEALPRQSHTKKFFFKYEAIEKWIDAGMPSN